MGSGRKRLPADRNPIPKGSEPGAEGRKKKKGKKSKHNKESSSTRPEKTHKSSLESTTTAEGQIMAQVCSTFSRLERSRFEAFRRATFPADAVSKYVAHCLIEEDGGRGGDSKRRDPILLELCAHGQAEEISIVVSTLAKAYAQRLVTSSRRLAGGQDQAIQPEHIIQAFHERQAKGADPGFFLQAASSTTKFVPKDGVHERKRLAALQSQDEYDKLHPLAEPDSVVDNPMDVSS